MTRISELNPIEMVGIIISEKSKCMDLAVDMESEVYSASRITKSPSEIAFSVLSSLLFRQCLIV